MKLLLSLLSIAIIASAESWQRRVVAVPNEHFAGAMRAGHGVITWGDTLREWDTTNLTSRLISRGPFGEGACLFGTTVVTVRGRGLGQLVSIGLHDGQSQVIDSAVEMHDCLEATLFGRTGVLIIHRGMQLRFYEPRPGAKWTSREIYSIYTPSYQAGLALSDIDGDGRTDILCGNYWVQSPERFELSWRLFAINTWFENPDSASMRIAMLGGRSIAVAQAHAAPARLARFDAPEDVKQLWIPAPLVPDLRVSRLHAIVPFAGGLVAGELNGPGSRLIWVDPGTGRSRVILTNGGTAGMVVLDSDTLLTVGPDGVTRHARPAD